MLFIAALAFAFLAAAIGYLSAAHGHGLTRLDRRAIQALAAAGAVSVAAAVTIYWGHRDRRP